MYFEYSNKRINAIKWDLIGEKECKEDAKLMAEFLRRMSFFVIENSVKYQFPYTINIAEELGNIIDTEQLLSGLSVATRTFLSDYRHYFIIIKSYLQLSLLMDSDIKFCKYIQIYEPLIKLLERGGNFVYRSGFIDVSNACSMPLHNWLSRIEHEPVDISKM